MCILSIEEEIILSYSSVISRVIRYLCSWTPLHYFVYDSDGYTSAFKAVTAQKRFDSGAKAWHNSVVDNGVSPSV